MFTIYLKLQKHKMKTGRNLDITWVRNINKLFSDCRDNIITLSKNTKFISNYKNVNIFLVTLYAK